MHTHLCMCNHCIVAVTPDEARSYDLQVLDVGNNRFTGSLDVLLGGMHFVTQFLADSNMLSGTLPAEVASLGIQVHLYESRLNYIL